jgi:hypothetical protein
VLGSPSTWSSAVARSSEVVMVPHSLTHSLTHSLGFWIVASFFHSLTHSRTHSHVVRWDCAVSIVSNDVINCV